MQAAYSTLWLFGCWKSSSEFPAAISVSWVCTGGLVRCNADHLDEKNSWNWHFFWFVSWAFFFKLDMGCGDKNTFWSKLDKSWHNLGLIAKLISSSFWRATTPFTYKSLEVYWSLRIYQTKKCRPGTISVCAVLLTILTPRYNITVLVAP